MKAGWGKSYDSTVLLKKHLDIYARGFNTELLHS